MSCLIRFDQTTACSRLLPARTCSSALIVDLIVDFLRAGFYGLRESKVLHLHEKAEYIAALARGKAMEVPMVRANMERRSLFLFERGKAF